MNMTKADEEKLQKLEIETVKAVTEMRGDIKSLTATISELKASIDKMNKNYVTKEEHLKDITDLEKKLDEAKRAGKIRSILVGVFTAIIVAVLTYEVQKLITS